MYNIETAMPKIDLEAIESHLRAAREEERRVSEFSYSFRKKYAMTERLCYLTAIELNTSLWCLFERCGDDYCMKTNESIYFATIDMQNSSLQLPRYVFVALLAFCNLIIYLLIEQNI